MYITRCTAAPGGQPRDHSGIYHTRYSYFYFEMCFSSQHLYEIKSFHRWLAYLIKNWSYVKDTSDIIQIRIILLCVQEVLSNYMMWVYYANGQGFLDIHCKLKSTEKKADDNRNITILLFFRWRWHGRISTWSSYQENYH